MEETAAIVLAAGKSTRMKSDLPKVLHEVCGRPMLRFVLDACRLAGVDRLFVVVGYGRDQVIQRFEDEPDVVWVEQNEQKGTGHAVQCCREALGDFHGGVMVIAGDMPLVRRQALANLIETRRTAGDAAAIATTFLDDPTGYGRIVRDEEGALEAIVEHADCTTEQRKIKEVNPSYYCFDADEMFSALEQVQPAAGKGEYYITDAVSILRRSGHGVSAKVTVPTEDATGINSRLDLAMVNRMMQDRIQLALMNDGVTILDPDNTWIEADVTVGCDTVIHPFTVIHAGASIGEGCRIGPFARIAGDETVPDGKSVGSLDREGATTS